MEDFSQSRGDDDLFDDEIIPIENPPPPEKVTIQLEQVSLEPNSVPPPIQAVSAAVPAPLAAKAPVPTTTDSSAPSLRSKPRGRGGQQTGRGGGSRIASAGLEDSKWAVKTADSNKPSSRPSKPMKSPKEESQPSPTQADTPIPKPTTDAEPASIQATEDTSPTSPSTAQPPTGPTNVLPAKTPAVRGDRTLTGGPARTKLTEEELSAKLAAAKERSQNVAAAHARAQADAASFEERERIAGLKRAVEKKERRAMEGEREKNRLRKLGNREGREWDRDKEDVLAGTNGRGGRGRGAYTDYGGRGFSGDQGEEDDLRQYEWHDDRGRGRGRGRGGRGDRGRAGRGRGGARGSDSQNQHQPDLSADSDFPSLPASATNPSAPKKNPSETKPGTKDTKPAPARQESIGGGGGGGTWADQVESSELNAENADKSKSFW
ncbi:hypothetical protein H2200_002223 [Cladophialophora chaetospira]|uniref:Uncharacterized protein n=1 Tax=Cladophialophora chaetospira TaxID=386627 RepID=A0AA38XIH5_9EURO|nr:hypothetical protein H2200_002223 [Cladophialophora chaetospira]